MAFLGGGGPAGLPLEGPLADLFGPDDGMGEEMVPVDMFFNDYVEQLSRGKRSLEPDAGAAGLAPKNAKLDVAQSVGGLMPQPGMAGGMQPQFMPAGPAALSGGGMLLPNGTPLLNGGAAAPPLPLVQPAGLGMLPGGFAGAAPMAAAPVPGQPFGLGGLGGAPLGMPGLDIPLDPAGVGGFGAASVSLSAGLGRGGDEAASADGGGAGGKGRNKTAKQQEANKIAQQRYRERKKAKFHEMEEQIAMLSKQLQALQALQSRNQILEGLNDELQAQLLNQEKEVERLKHALEAAAERSLSQPHSPDSSGYEGDAAAAAAAAYRLPECGPCGPCDPTPQDLAGVDFQKGFDEQITKLRAFLQQHSLEESTDPAKPLSREVTADLGQLVGRGCQLCQAALRTAGVQVVELISRDPASFSRIGSADDSARWQRCLDAMALTGEQQEQLLLNRRAHLQRMRGIYQERHNLNMQAMSLMLPHSSRNPAEDNTVEGRLASMSSGGYLPVAKSSAELGDVLDRIKDNLRREQRAVMDLNCQTVTRILTPLQAAYYMLRAYPVHCDALALSNTLAKRLGREDISGDGAAAAPAAAAEVSTGGCRQQGQ